MVRLMLFLGLVVAVACAPPSAPGETPSPPPSPTAPPSPPPAPIASPSPSGPSPSPSPQVPAPTAPGPSPTARPTPSAGPSPSATPSGEICGYLRAGVEAGCLILEADDGKEYLLVFRGAPPPEVRNAMDKRVCVTGRPVEVVSYCMQGTPLAVDSFRVVGP